MTDEKEKKELSPEEQRALEWDEKKVARRQQKRADKARLQGRLIVEGPEKNRKRRRGEAPSARNLARLDAALADLNENVDALEEHAAGLERSES